jgi:gas vesicle protein
MFEFLAGMIVGGVMGVLVAALCVAASKEDRP